MSFTAFAEDVDAIELVTRMQLVYSEGVSLLTGLITVEKVKRDDYCHNPYPVIYSGIYSIQQHQATYCS